jgi:hypothetical protein
MRPISAAEGLPKQNFLAAVGALTAFSPLKSLDLAKNWDGPEL